MSSKKLVIIIISLFFKCLEKDDAEQWYRSIKVSSVGLSNQGTVHPHLQGNCKNILITDRVFPSTQLTHNLNNKLNFLDDKTEQDGENCERRIW